MTTTQLRIQNTPEIMQTTINGITRYNTVRTGNVMTKICAMAQVWKLRSNTRRQLGQLDDHCLGDIGVERIDAMIETRKWFWQA